MERKKRIKYKTGTVRLNVFLMIAPEICAEIKTISDREGKSLNLVLNEILNNYFGGNGKALLEN